MHAPPAETAAKSSAIMASAKDDAFPLPRVRLVGAHSSRTFNSHARLLSADAHMPRPREAPEAARSPRRAFGLSKRALCTRSILTRLLSADAHMPPAETVTALRRQRFPFHRNPSAPRLLSSRLVQPARRAAALAGFVQGRGKLSAHAAHRVDHLVRGHDQSHARNCGVRGAWH